MAFNTKVYTKSDFRTAASGGCSTGFDDNFTASRVMISNGSGKLLSSIVTSGELGFLTGVTSNIQNQINLASTGLIDTGRVSLITTTHIAEGSNLYFTNVRAVTAISGGASTIAGVDLTIGRVLISTAAGKVGISVVTSGELGFLSGVTSSIQTQLDSKVAKSTFGTTGDLIYASASGTPSALGISSSGKILTSNGTTPFWATDRRIMQQFVFDATIASGDRKAVFVIQEPYANKNLVFAHAAVLGSGTTGTLQIQIQRDRSGTLANMLSTVLSVDSMEYGSDTAASTYVINTSNDDVLVNDRLYGNIVGLHTTPASGLILTLGFE